MPRKKLVIKTKHERENAERNGAGLVLYEGLQKTAIMTTHIPEKALSLMQEIEFGLIHPKDEALLTGELEDIKKITYQVTYTLEGIKEAVVIKIDDLGGIWIDAHKAAQISQKQMIKIITIFCTFSECVKAVVEFPVFPPRGFIKPSGVGISGIYAGEETVSSLPIQELYEIDFEQYGTKQPIETPQIDSSKSDEAHPNEDKKDGL